MRSFATLLSLLFTSLLRFQVAGAQPFPSFVLVKDLNSPSLNKYCAGVLIHSDLILTDTSCEGKWVSNLALVGVTNLNLPLVTLDTVDVAAEIKSNLLPGLPSETMIVKLTRKVIPTEAVATLATIRPIPILHFFIKVGFVTAINPPYFVTTLQKQTLNVITPTDCRQIIAAYYGIDATTVFDDNNMLCADVATDNCVDDLGSVVFDAVTGQVVGFAQQSISVCRDTNKPAQGLPTVYRDVAVFYSALRAAICRHSSHLTLADNCIPTPSPITPTPPTPPQPTRPPTPSNVTGIFDAFFDFLAFLVQAIVGVVLAIVG